MTVRCNCSLADMRYARSEAFEIFATDAKVQLLLGWVNAEFTVKLHGAAVRAIDCPIETHAPHRHGMPRYEMHKRLTHSLPPAAGDYIELLHEQLPGLARSWVEDSDGSQTYRPTILRRDDKPHAGVLPEYVFKEIPPDCGTLRSVRAIVMNAHVMKELDGKIELFRRKELDTHRLSANAAVQRPRAAACALALYA
jgi:hypothetical protein